MLLETLVTNILVSLSRYQMLVSRGEPFIYISAFEIKCQGRLHLAEGNLSYNCIITPRSVFLEISS